eukprot:1556073-Prymnesium_polylepis.1
MPATTKAIELQLLLNSAACAATMHDGVNVSIKIGTGPLKKPLASIVEKDAEALVQPTWTLVLKPPPPLPLTPIRVAHDVKVFTSNRESLVDTLK